MAHINKLVAKKKTFTLRMPLIKRRLDLKLSLTLSVVANKSVIQSPSGLLKKAKDQPTQFYFSQGCHTNNSALDMCHNQ